VCSNGSSEYVAGQLDQGVRCLSTAQSVPTVTNTVTLLPSTPCSVPFLSPVGTHIYQHCHTAALHNLFRTFPQPSRYPQLPTLSHCCPPHTKLSPNAQLHTGNSPLAITSPSSLRNAVSSFHFYQDEWAIVWKTSKQQYSSSQLTNTHYISLHLPSPFNSFSLKVVKPGIRKLSSN
jgi:hypothetical protein